MLYRQLECFLTVAQVGSISRAAAAMFLTQPSLTARVQALEREIGTQLFVRSKQGMRLTEAGREFLPYAERCIASIENGKQHLRDLRDDTDGCLKLSALPRVSTYTLPTMLQEFALFYPHVNVSVRTGHSEDIVDMVLAEVTQLGLARPVSHPEIESTSLYEEELILVVDPQHRFAQQERVVLEELGEEQLVLFDRASSNYELTKSMFQEAGIQEPRIMELDNIEAAKKTVEHRLGVSFLPRQAIARAVAAGRLCEVEVDDIPNLGRAIAILRRSDVPPMGNVAAFLDLATRTNHDLDVPRFGGSPPL